MQIRGTHSASRQLPYLLFGALFGFTFTTLIVDVNHEPAEPASNLLGPVATEKRPIKLLCWIATMPPNHETKAVHIKATWAPRCDRYMFMSSVNSTDLPAVAAVHKEGRQFLWQKTAFALNYVWTHFGEDFDFFYKADDDTYALIDNMRLLLANHDPSIPAIIGKVHQYVVKQGYADGGAGYVMSRAALRLFVHGMKNTSMCYNETHSEFEDMKVGACAEALGIPAIPAVDGKGYLKFFTKSPLDYLRTGGIKASLSFVNHRQVCSSSNGS
ncbi:Glycoprotein-N-acetylgalactosamine 3-beta-galactosyltransferase 1 [Clonorchis sinensis]|uniref:N-acetylgalactosaminide beta-1,3-galactosyltransferase n=1 Tax=Clonorchis sinensis TaxID=79923 RepID=A0A8T1MQ46_CLOSI|nr:Glycoprotein-N-acetylgalactosamine 3-beta-galactosyltransferase 1 [Clonorchis sinensis]